MIDIENLSELQLSLIAEVGNIGAGNAASALSEMIQKKVSIEIPFVKYLQINEMPEILGGSDIPVTCVTFKMQGGLDGYIVFILSNQSAQDLAQIVAGDMPISQEDILSEVSNIISGAYLRSLTEMIGGTIDISVPEYSQEMLGAILDIMLGDLYYSTNYSFVIATNLIVDQYKLEGYYALLPDMKSLKHIIETIGKLYNI